MVKIGHNIFFYLLQTLNCDLNSTYYQALSRFHLYTSPNIHRFTSSIITKSLLKTTNNGKIIHTHLYIKKKGDFVKTKIFKNHNQKTRDSDVYFTNELQFKQI